MPSVDHGGGIYEARYGFTRRMLLLEGICLLFLLTALLPMPWWIVVMDVGFFGFAGVVLLVLPLSRRLAFRVDTQGVTLGGSFPRFRGSTAFIPWRDVIELHLFELPYGRPPTPYIQVVRQEGAPELPRGMGFGRVSQRFMGPELAACRQVVAWSLDVEALRGVLANVAPEVRVTGSLGSLERRARRPLSQPNAKLRFVWAFLVPLAIGAMFYLTATHLVPAWSAHLGHGRLGTWTVVETPCAGKGGCTPLGDFVANDGSDVRLRMQMAHGGPAIPAVGGSIPAVDTGDPDHVYPVGGGYYWVIYSLVTLGACVLAPLWLWTVPISALRRRLQRTRTAA